MNSNRHCNFETRQIGETTWLHTCKSCGYSRTTVTPRLYRYCNPKLSNRVWSWVSAVGKWLIAGSPTRSEAEVARIYNDICTPCPKIVKHDNGDTACGVCKCRLSSRGWTLRNKIAMATEKCPLNRW